MCENVFNAGHLFLYFNVPFPRRDFVFWYLPQLQYKNPNVQIVTFKNITPSPFIKCYYGNRTFTISKDLFNVRLERWKLCFCQ